MNAILILLLIFLLIISIDGVDAKLGPINSLVLHKLSKTGNVDLSASKPRSSDLFRGGKVVKKGKKVIQKENTNEFVEKAKAVIADIKPVTRAYTILILLCSLVQMVGLPAPAWFGVDGSRLLEVWRPITASAYFGPPSLSLINSLYFLLRYGQVFEATQGSGEYAWFLLVQASILTILGLWLGFPFHGQSMISAIIYLSSREQPMEKMMFQFGLTITSWQLPYYMMLIDCLASKSLSAAWPHVLGMLSGHIFHFANTVWPALGGKAMLPCPKWFHKQFGNKPQFSFGTAIPAKEGKKEEEQEEVKSLNRNKAKVTSKKFGKPERRKLGSE